MEGLDAVRERDHLCGTHHLRCESLKALARLSICSAALFMHQNLPQLPSMTEFLPPNREVLAHLLVCPVIHQRLTNIAFEGLLSSLMRLYFSLGAASADTLPVTLDACARRDTGQHFAFTPPRHTGPRVPFGPLSRAVAGHLLVDSL